MNNGNRVLLKPIAAAATALSLGLGCVAAANAQAESSGTGAPTGSTPAPTGGSGASAGPSDPNPYYIGVAQAFTRDSNVYRVPSGPGDTYSSTSLFGGFIQPISRQRVYGRANVSENRYKDEKQLNANRQQVVDILQASFGTADANKVEFNNAGQAAIAEKLREPLQRVGVPLSEEDLQKLVKSIVDYKVSHGGLLKSFDEVSGVSGVTPQVVAALKENFALAPFTILSADVVGPKVGGELRTQAILATLYALGGMLVYIAFRFEWLYGVAAVVAVFHDTLITIGLFSLFNKPIDLTVVAALLTLVGYSMNDTIVVFDRIRENLRHMRRENMGTVINLSINQTLSRTILTSGLTFLTAVSLYLFGGEVLHGFSFALVVGILVGTYSSVFVASPILLFGQNVVENRNSGGAGSVSGPKELERGAAKALPKKAARG